ncbi:hypothetical protein FQN60_017636 [Etheostoma spectabile]|uniref:Uncharacterized protein n=1 Tax=Etheostoma spectabile TaxID=54343 RepID=A0A5J5DFZ7_9PERO|nr:hypothetical protein FQN60_017636 [Etheostoma spectabile]
MVMRRSLSPQKTTQDDPSKVPYKPHPLLHISPPSLPMKMST